MTDLEPTSKEAWEELANQVRDRFYKVFGERADAAHWIRLIYHDGDYADNSIDIDGILEIGEVEEEISTINGIETQRFWQLFTVSYDPGNYHTPPDCDVNEVGVPHRRLDDCIREAVKLYAEYSFDAYMEHLADEEQAKYYEEMETEGSHSWKP